MAQTYTIPTTRKQREALYNLFCRRHDPSYEGFESKTFRRAYRTFRKGFRHYLGGYVGGMWCGMFIGIETDGYTHS